MKIVRGIALVSSILTLLHGSYFPVYFLSLGIMAFVGVSTFPPVSWTVLLFVALDTCVYLFLGVSMLRGKESSFVYSIVWAVWGALLAAVTLSYGGYAGYALNLLSFLIVFCSTYYYTSANRANPDVSKAVGTIAGILGFAQGIIIAIAVALPFAGMVAEFDLAQASASSTLLLLLATGAVYFLLGIGMLKGRKDFFSFAILWTVIEAAFAVAYTPIMGTHLNVISILIVAFATYSYFAKKQ